MPSSYPANLTTLLGWVDIRDFSVDSTGNNDCTSGFQTALNQIGSAGLSTTLYVPAGTYAIGGSINGTTNSQLVLPSLTGTSGSPQITLRILGAIPPPLVVVGLRGCVQPPAGAFTRLVSSATTGFVFGVAGTSGSWLLQTPQGGYFSALDFSAENLWLSVGTATGGFNLAYAAAIDFQDVVIYSSNSGLPATSAQVGIVSPYELNDGVSRNTIDRVYCANLYCGMQLSEHIQVRKAQFDGCHDAVQLLESQHSIMLERIGVQHCYNGINVVSKDPYVSSNYTRFICHMYAGEHNTSGVYSGGYDVLDPNNYGSGLLWYAMNGVLGAFTKSGGTNITCTSISPGGANP